MTEAAPQTAGEILAAFLSQMTGNIRAQMGHVCIDTAELLRCIEKCAQTNPFDDGSVRSAAYIAASAAGLYVEHVQQTTPAELTVTTFIPFQIGHVTLQPGKWRVQYLGRG